MTNQYPTPEEIQEFLKAHEDGGAEAIANLLREKQKARLERPPKKSKSKPRVLGGTTTIPGDLEVESWRVLVKRDCPCGGTDKNCKLCGGRGFYPGHPTGPRTDPHSDNRIDKRAKRLFEVWNLMSGKKR